MPSKIGEELRAILKRGRNLPASLEDNFRPVVNGAFGDKEPDVLCHYSWSMDNIVSILRSGEVWAFDCRSARGGTRDLEVATSVIVGVLGELASEQPGRWSRLCSLLQRDYERGLKFADHDTIYVACFCASPNNPRMWNSDFGGFGAGANVQIEMPAEERLGRPEWGTGFYRVEYDPAVLRQRVKAAMLEVCSVARRLELVALDTRDELEGFVGGCLFRLAAMAEMIAKEESCQYQQEWRIAVHLGRAAPLPQMRDGRRYVPFRLRADRKSLIKARRIVLGPKAPPEHATRLRHELQAIGYGEPGAEAMPEIVALANAPADRHGEGVDAWMGG
jgi:hypothetical protein